MADRLTDEHLHRIVHDPYMCTDDQHRRMAVELIERRAREAELGIGAEARVVGYFPAAIERLPLDDGQAYLMHSDRPYIPTHERDRVWEQRQEAAAYLALRHDEEADFTKPLPWKIHALVELPSAPNEEGDRG